MAVFRPHSHKQEEAIYSEAKITAILTGIQFGKSTTGAVRQKRRMHTYIAPDDTFIIAAPTYKIMAQSTLPAFLRIMDGCGDFNKSDMTYSMRGGGTCYMRTATDPDSVVGITNCRGIWLDEGGKVSLYFYENLMARAAFKDCQIDITSSPYSLNWVYKDIVRPKLRDPSARPDVRLIQAASNENPYFPKAEWDRNRLVMDPRRFKMVFGGEWDRPAGLVYDFFDEDLNQCDPFELPSGTRFFGGIDWGYTEPFVFMIRAVTPSGQHYDVSEFYQSNLIIDQQCDEVARKCAVWPVETIYAGPDRPENISKMNGWLKAAGIRTAVVAANNAKRLGVDTHYELIKSRRYKLFRGMCPKMIDELDTYHYPEEEDLGPDEKEKESLPVEQNDHCLDAARYCSMGTFRVHERKAPSVPSGETSKQESPFQMIERLKRKPRMGGGEEWSA